MVNPVEPGRAPGGESIYESWQERRHHGQAETFADLCARHASIADELRQIHDACADLGRVLRRLGPPTAGDVAGSLSPVGSLDSDEYLDALFPGLLAGLNERGSRFDRFRFSSEHPPLGEGGMGLVVKAWDTELAREVALKFLKDGRRRSRFLREARVTALLDHPGVVPIHELGLDPKRRPYYAMRMIEGEDMVAILSRLRAGAAPEWLQTRVIGVLLRVCETLAYAHERGVVHRDLKPANVMVGKHGEVYVVDWGVARLYRETDSDADGDERADGRIPALSRADDIVGTPAYMSPEQARGERDRIGPAADVYAVGAILYEILAGMPPYGDVPDGPLNRILVGEAPTPLERCAPATPPELAAICATAMALEPEDRYPSMAELADDLSAYLEDRVVRVHRTGVWIELRKWIRRNRVVAALAGLLLVLVPVLAGLTSRTIRTRDAVAAASRRALEREAQGHLISGFLKLGQSIHDAAIDEFTAALRAIPDSPAAVAGIALVGLRTSRPEQVLFALDGHPTTKARAAFGLLRADAMRALHRTADAEAIERQLPDPADPMDYFILGERAVAGGRVDNGIDWFYRSVLSSREPVPYVYQRLAFALWLARDERGRDVANALLALWPDDLGSRFYSGLALLAANQREAAVAELERAAQMAPQTPEVHNALGLALAEIPGEEGRAIAEYQRAIELRPGFVAPHVNLGNLYHASRDFGAAERWYRAAIEFDPDLTAAQHGLAETLYDSGRTPASIESYERTLLLVPTHREAAINLGNAYCELNLPERALPILQRVCSERPHDMDAREQLGRALALLWRIDEAIEEFHETLTIDPARIATHINLGLALLTRGEFAAGYAAIAEGDRLANRSPNPQFQTAGLVAQYRRFVELEGRLAAVAAGETPDEAAECFTFAEMAYWRRDYPTAARLSAHALHLGTLSSATPDQEQRYFAACAMARVGQLEDAAGLLDRLLADSVEAVRGERVKDWQLRAKLRGWRLDPALSDLFDSPEPSALAFSRQVAELLAAADP